MESPDDPKAAARAAGLRYTPDDVPGITRRRVGTGWSYRDPDGAVPELRIRPEGLPSRTMPGVWGAARPGLTR